MSLAAFGALPRAWMSGLGDPSIPGSPDYVASLTPAGATGIAVKSVATDPSLAGTTPTTGMPVLSPFSNINMAYLGTTVGTVMNAPIQALANAVISAMPSSIMSTISEVMSAVSGVGGAMPFVGQAITFAGAIIGMIESLGPEAHKNEEIQNVSQLCQSFVQDFAVVPSGGAEDPCQMCPADIFYPGIRDPNQDRNTGWDLSSSAPNSSWCQSATVPPPVMCAGSGFGPNGEPPGTYPFRSGLGQALMLITEGGVFDPYEIHNAAWRQPYQSYCDDAYNKIRGVFGSILTVHGRTQEGGWWMIYGGVPPARRALFRSVRRGIQAASKYYTTSTDQLTDAGLSLWPIYMDLLLNAYDTGQLNDEFVSYMLSHKYIPLNDVTKGSYGAGEVTVNYWMGAPEYPALESADVAPYPGCADAYAKQIRQLVESWRNTSQHPATKLGASRLASYVQKASDIAAEVAAGPPKMTVVPKDQFARVIRVARKPPPSKLQIGSGLLGAGAAAAVVYFFL